MRASFALFAAVAAAVPQGVQPISQISDGQIQAPPATIPSVVAPSVVPSGSAPVVSPSAPVVAPSVSAPAGKSTLLYT
jgi:hypothetical protein